MEFTQLDNHTVIRVIEDNYYMRFNTKTFGRIHMNSLSVRKVTYEHLNNILDMVPNNLQVKLFMAYVTALTLLQVNKKLELGTIFTEVFREMDLCKITLEYYETLVDKDIRVCLSADEFGAHILALLLTPVIGEYMYGLNNNLGMVTKGSYCNKLSRGMFVEFYPSVVEYVNKQLDKINVFSDESRSFIEGTLLYRGCVNLYIDCDFKLHMHAILITSNKTLLQKRNSDHYRSKDK